MQENALKNVIWEMVAILSLPHLIPLQCMAISRLSRPEELFGPVKQFWF